MNIVYFFLSLKYGKPIFFQCGFRIRIRIKINWILSTAKKLCLHGSRSYILISEPGQPFRSQFVLYRTDIGLIKQTINRTSRCSKVDAVRLYAPCRLNLLLLKSSAQDPINFDADPDPGSALEKNGSGSASRSRLFL